MAAQARVAATPAQANQAAAQAAQQAAARLAANANFLRTTLRKQAVCPPAAGAGINQAYSSGQTLIYDVPTANGAFLESILVECNLTVNPAVGTGSAYALNAGAPWTLIDTILVEYGSTQAKLRPLVLKYLELFQGYERSQPEQINTGTSVTFVGNTVWGTPFNLTTNTNNPWKFWFRLPLRRLPRRAAGMLPIQGDSTKCQVKIVLASSALGPANNAPGDPILTTISTTAGTGGAVTVAGTIEVVAEYRDGTNLLSPRPLSLDLTGEPTIQYIIDRQLNPLTAGSILRQKIDSKLQHLYLLSIIVDGLQATKFASDSNLQVLELDQDSGGQNAFARYGVTGANIGITEFLEQFREARLFGQDVDEGVIPWVPGPAALGTAADLLEGNSYLNMMPPGGWTDTNYAVQVGSVSSTNFTPRVETYCVSVNPLGLIRGA